MNNKYIFLFGVLALALIAGGAVVFTQTQNQTGTSGSISIQGDSEYDFGQIDIEGGDVQHQFSFSNSSKDSLIIRSALTSCMCTEVQLQVGDETSPVFGMHGNGTWNYEVAAGETVELTATFDPMAHGPEGVGTIERSVFVITSAEPDGDAVFSDANIGQGGIIEFRFKADVVPHDEYRAPDVAFQFEKLEHDFGVIKQSGGLVSYDFAFEYKGAEEIEITDLIGSCSCTTATTETKTLRPGDSGIITVTFDPNLHEEPEGRFFKTISISTQPEIEVPDLKIWAEIDLDLGADAYKEVEHED